MASMKETIRDTYRDKAFYDAQLDELHGLVEKNIDPAYLEKRGSNNPSLQCVAIGRAGMYAMESVISAYARGDTAESLRVDYQRFMELLSQSEDCFETHPRYNPHYVNLTNPSFALSAIVFGVALGFGEADLVKIAQGIPSGRDQLIDRVMAIYQPGRSVHDQLYKAAVYRKLNEVFDAPKEKRAALIEKYLNHWEKALEKDGRWGRHTKPSFRGYWCYEAAAVVAALQIDDRDFQDHPYYPGELMAWRGHSE